MQVKIQNPYSNRLDKDSSLTMMNLIWVEFGFIIIEFRCHKPVFGYTRINGEVKGVK